MLLQIVVVMVCAAAQIAYKRLIEWHHIELILQLSACVLVLGRGSRKLLFLNQLVENASPTVKRVPDTAELSQWSKD